MPYRTDLNYRYDGSYEGFLCCVFESFAKKELPTSIFPPEAQQTSLFPTRTIQTYEPHAKRVLRSIPLRIAPDAEDFIWQAFLTCLEDKETHLLKFMRLGYRHGAGVMDMLTDDTVAILQKAVRHLGGEINHYMGFVRFSDFDGALVSVIEPKNFVLPLLKPHFTDRFAGEVFLLYDNTHKTALIHQGGKHAIVPLDELTLPSASESELYFRKLWTHFYNTIGIESRYNPRCRMTLMPKRYWAQMTEFQTENQPTGDIGNPPRPVVSKPLTEDSAPGDAFMLHG